MKTGDSQKTLPLLQRSFVSNLLGRVNGSGFRKKKHNSGTYCHPYQFIPSIKPNYLVHVDLNRCETPDPDLPSFTNLAECLGFSPDGKYLAFHSHGRSSISILTYSGVEGGKAADQKALPSDFFGKMSKLDLTKLTKDYNYENERTLGSWWTDDSSTLIIHLAMEGADEDDEQNAPDEEALFQANNIVRERTRSWRIGNSENEMSGLDATIHTTHDENGDENNVNRVEQNQSTSFHFDRECDLNIQFDEESLEMFFDKQSRSSLCEDESVSPSKTSSWTMQHGETSRTTPFLLAMETSARMAFDEERVKGETSRTMPVYHALTSSIIQKDPVVLEEEDFDPLVGTSNSLRRCRDNDLPQIDEPEQKRLKDENLEELSVADRIRNALELKKEIKVSKSKNKDGLIRRTIDSMRLCPEYEQQMMRKGLNNSGLGYSRPGSCVRRRTPYASRSKNLLHADSLRDTLRNLSFWTPSHLNVANQEEKRDLVMMFVAYNVQSGAIAPLIFKDVVSPFNCHMRDRTLTVSFNNDSVETYNICTAENKWNHHKQFRLSQEESISVQLHFRTATMPGMPSLNEEVQIGEVFDDLFDSEAFNSPIQQDVVTLLYREIPELFEQNTVLTKSPEISRCHMLSHSLLAITMKYSCEKPIHLGVIVSLQDLSVTVYPDYHKFLKILLTNHLPDLLPRHWTYLNPFPVTEQPWFKKEFIDISNPEEFIHFERLIDIYNFLSENWNNVKSTSNMFKDSFISNSASHFLSKYIFPDGRRIPISGRDMSQRKHMEQFYHPTDPFLVMNTISHWFFGLRRKDPDDVIVHTDLIDA